VFLGGIVTFTPQAIANDPFGSLELMEQLSEHPFWSVYLLPWVVGIAAHEMCVDEDPLAVFDK
jgi:hypothetical protein